LALKKSALGWVPVYEILIIALGLFVSTLMVTELVRYGHDLLPILYILGLAVLLYGFVDCRPLSFRGLEVSLSFPIVLVALLLLVNEFPAISRVATLAATGIAILGSLISESLRRLARPRLPIGRSLVRILFYASYQALAGFAAAQIYLKGYNLGWGQNWGRLFIQPTLAYTVVYALIYSLASQVIVLPHDWASSRLLLPADEIRFPRVDLLTLLAIAPFPLAVFYLFTGEAGWALVVIFLIFAGFLGFLGVAGSYARIDITGSRRKAKEGLRRQLSTLVNMRELWDEVGAILRKGIEYTWVAIYSSAESAKSSGSDTTSGVGTATSAHSGTRIYYLRGTLEKTRAGLSVDHYEPRFFLKGRKHILATVSKGLQPTQVVSWPCRVVSGEGCHLGEVARTGQSSPSIRGEGGPPASNSDPYLPSEVIAMYVPVRHKGETIGLLALTRSPKQFKETERQRVELLSEAMSESLRQIQRIEAQLEGLYNDVEEYTTDPVKFQRVIKELTDVGVDVFLILDLVMQSAFRNNVLAVMKGIVKEDRAAEQDELYLSDKILCEIYEEACRRKPDMPPLDDKILEGLKLIPSSLSLAFSFHYQWPKRSRGSKFIRLYRFLAQAMKARSVRDIVGLRTEEPSTAKEPDQTIEELKQQRFPHSEIINLLKGMIRIVDNLEQNLLYEAMNKIAELKYLTSENITNPERFIFLTLLDSWDAIINTTIAEREGAAKMSRAGLEIALRSKRALPLVPVTVGLRLENAGPGTAFQVVVKMLSSPDYRVVGESQINLGMLPPLKAHDLEFTIEPVNSQELDLQFQIAYRDPEQKWKSFEDTLHLREVPPLFAPMPNPYVPGKALRTSSRVFYGRQDIFQFVNQNMDASTSQQRVLLLIGERRIGKTSVLKQLPACVKDKRYVHIYFDCHAIEGIPNVISFFQRLTMLIGDSLEEGGTSMDRPSEEDLKNNAYLFLEQEFLPQVWERIGDRRLLVAVDEFERLDRYVEEGKMEGLDFAAPLRALIQHQDWLAFVFAGTHQLEALFSKYWSVFFNMAQQKTIGFLSQEEARGLITEPVRGRRVYDDLAVEEVLRATGGHPYFLQVMCDRLMNLCSTERRSYVTIRDVRDVSEEVLATGRAHLTFVWDESDQAEQDVLAGLAKALAVDPCATVDTIVRHLERAGRPRARPDIREALRRLETRRRIVTREPGPGDIGYYSFTAGLYELWIQKYHSLD
jgi:hypothetical protein